METKTLKERWDLYQKGSGEQPSIATSVKLLVEGEVVRAVLSKEIEDRDGEVVLISGIDILDKQVPLLDSHRMNDTVTENVLGSVINMRQRDRDGVATLEGELKFAPTPKGKIAAMLVKGGFVDRVSIGFGVKEYDPATRFINKSELYEVSLVSVPANPEAKIDVSKSLKEQEEDVNKVEKMLNHYKTIKAPFKQVTKTFLSDTFCKTVGYEKEGNLLIDLDAIYNVVLSKYLDSKEETPQESETTSQDTTQISQKTPTSEQIVNAINESIKQAVDKSIDKYVS
jgi:HK97 family phage prohead protease